MQLFHGTYTNEYAGVRSTGISSGFIGILTESSSACFGSLCLSLVWSLSESPRDECSPRRDPEIEVWTLLGAWFSPRNHAFLHGDLIISHMDRSRSYGMGASKLRAGER